MDSLYLAVYRTYIAFKKLAIAPLLHRWPRAETGFTHLKDFLKGHGLRSRAVWLQVQSGFARGLWMRLRIPEEAGFWRGEHEPDVQNTISEMVGPGDVVYDVGAHLGSLALGTALLVGASGRVVAFDGAPENVERLRENSLRNQLGGRIQAVHAAVWSYSSETGISFRRGASEMSQGGVEADGNRPVLGNGDVISVPVTTLDDFIAGGGLVPHLVKIDVEGGEYEVLRGGATLFAKQRPLIIVEVHHEHAAQKIGAWLEDFHYAAEWRIPKEKFPRCLTAWPIERTPPIVSTPHAAE